MNKDKIVKIWNKIKYPIEFMIVVLFMIGVYRFITVKAYQGYWSRNLLIYLFFTGIIALAIIIYNCFQDKDKIEKMFINFAIPIGIMYIVFMLPTYTPDASAHIWKAYEVSNGILLTPKDNNGNSIVPEALSKYRETVLTKYSVLEEAIQTEEANDYNKTTEVNSPAKSYCTIYYIGYAIGFAIARILSLNIFLGIFLARIINFIIFLVIGYIAIKIIPFGKILLAVYLLIPMMVQQATAVTVDSLMNVGIILFIAYTFKLAFKKEKLEKKEEIIFLVLTILIGVSKLTYLPLIGLGLILAKRRKELNKKQKIILGIVTIVVCLISAFTLNRLTSGYPSHASEERYLEEAGVNSSEQIKGIVTNPVQYLKVLCNNFKVNVEFYLYSFIGQYMGWLSILFPVPYIYLYIALLFVAIFVENNNQVLDRKEKIWGLLLALIMYLLVVTGLYIEWSAVGGEVVAGVQGRYFLPITILTLLCICKKNNYIKIKNPNVVIPLCSFLINGLFIRQIIMFFI